MSVEDSSSNEEALVYRSWADDPEQVENLVTLLEAKTQTAPTVTPQWKYGHEYLYDVMFPQGDSEWEPSYKRAFRPSVQSFRSALASLANGSRTFGNNIPPELGQRFHNVMAERSGTSISNRAPDDQPEKLAGLWTREKRLLAAGLTEYTKLTNEETARFFKEKLGADIMLSTINSMRTKWRRDAEFPYDKDRQLSQDDASVELFIKVLEYENLTLNDVLDWLKKNSSAPLADMRIIRMEEMLAKRREKTTE